MFDTSQKAPIIGGSFAVENTKTRGFLQGSKRPTRPLGPPISSCLQLKESDVRLFASFCEARTPWEYPFTIMSDPKFHKIPWNSPNSSA